MKARGARSIGYVMIDVSRLAMKLETWLEQAMQDAERRGLVGLRPLLEALARSTAALRAADWNRDLSSPAAPPSKPNAR